MRAYDYIRELPGGVRFVNRETESLMFVTLAEDRFHHVDRGWLFNILNGKIEEAELHFPSSWSKKMLLDKFDLDVPVCSVVGTTVISKPRKGDESPPDPTENPRAYNL